MNQKLWINTLFQSSNKSLTIEIKAHQNFIFYLQKRWLTNILSFSQKECFCIWEIFLNYKQLRNLFIYLFTDRGFLSTHKKRTSKSLFISFFPENAVGQSREKYFSASKTKIRTWTWGDFQKPLPKGIWELHQRWIPRQAFTSSEGEKCE